MACARQYSLRIAHILNEFVAALSVLATVLGFQGKVSHVPSIRSLREEVAVCRLLGAEAVIVCCRYALDSQTGGLDEVRVMDALDVASRIINERRGRARGVSETSACLTMARSALRRTFITALLAMLLWVLTFIGIALLRDGCGLDYVLPWYSSAHDHCPTS